MVQVILANVGCNTAPSTPDTLRFATEGYSHPSAAGYYKGRIISVSGLRRTMFAGGATSGQTRATDGTMVVANLDGDGDAYDTYGYGLAADLLVGKDDLAPGSMVTVFEGVAELASVARSDITFQLTDRSRELLKPVSPAKYDGSNSGTSGIEGTENDLKGRTKIRMWGKRKRFKPHLVNRPGQIFAVNHDASGASAPVTSYDRVSIDTGTGYADWTLGSDRANLAALQAATPLQGVYDTCLALGLMKMGGTVPTEALGRVVVDVTEGSSADDRKVAGIIKRLLVDAGVSAGDVISADYTALLADNANATGVVIEDESQYPRVIDMVAGYAGAWWGPDRLSQYGMGLVDDPSAGSTVATLRKFSLDVAAGLDDFNIIDIRPVANADSAVPLWRVSVNGSEVVAEDAAVKDQFPPRELAFDIYFASDTHIQDEADRRLDLYKVVRRSFEVDVRLTGAVAQAIDIGDVVEVVHPRFGFSGGVKMMVTGIEYAVRPEQIMTLTVWG